MFVDDLEADDDVAGMTSSRKPRLAQHRRSDRLLDGEQLLVGPYKRSKCGEEFKEKSAWGRGYHSSIGFSVTFSMATAHLSPTDLWFGIFGAQLVNQKVKRRGCMRESRRIRHTVCQVVGAAQLLRRRMSRRGQWRVGGVDTGRVDDATTVQGVLRMMMMVMMLMMLWRSAFENGQMEETVER